MHRVFKTVAILLAACVVLALLGFYGWTRLSRYPAFEDAAALAADARTAQGWYAFEPEGEPVAGFVFYPGGLVDPAAYAPLMQRLSDGGVLAVIVPMPLDLAVFGIHRADDVIAAYPEVEHWAIGGHSLGGAMASEYVKSHPGVLDGFVLLAAHPGESTDLSATDADTLSIYGTEDGVLPDVFKDSLARLPADTTLLEIPGGNHAQFGHYGPQKGDGIASIDREEQQRITAESILALLSSLRQRA